MIMPLHESYFTLSKYDSDASTHMEEEKKAVNGQTQMLAQKM